ALWCTRRGLSIPASLLAGTCFNLSGAFVLHIYAGHLSLNSALAWIPLLFLVTDLLFEQSTPGRILLGMFAVAMQLVAGHPQFVYYTALSLGLYTALRLCVEPRRWRVIVALAAVYVGGVALSAVHLFPSVDAVAGSTG